MREQDQLRQLVEGTVTLVELREALKSGNWSRNVGYFLNPLVGVIAHQNPPEHLVGTLRRHSERKLITLKRMMGLE